MKTMKAILNFRGWKKVVTLEFGVPRNGVIEYCITETSPESLLLDVGSEIIKEEITLRKVEFVYRGKKEHGLPVFEYLN